ncbi:MAG: hypothetical protein LAT56_14220 [Wenzhouxiangella sp.]|nr:hypothetical protein [Wenzhouxiangella sp.]
MSSLDAQPANTHRDSRLLAGFLLAIVIAATGLVYSLAFSGAWYFDDEGNLGDMRYICDLWSWMHYVFGGVAGPSGRPLALASFALQSGAWPDSIQPFLAVNTLIHLLNTLLVFACARAIASLTGHARERALWFAVFVSACWSFAPFLASASLMVVQRMTTLSALFVFAGLWLYLHGRSIMPQQSRKALIAIAAAIFLCTPLAVLAKENGALLLPLLLLTERLLLRSRYQWGSRRAERTTVWFLTVATLLLVAFVISRGLATSAYQFRDFTWLERLLTQGRVIVGYITHLLLPNAASTLPFTDNFPVSRGLWQPPATVLSWLALLAVIACLPWLKKRALILVFGIAWFMTGHLMESTVLPLELYFAHRNYVPAFGLFLCLGWLVILAPLSTKLIRPVRLGAAGYAILSLAALLNTTTLWGDPRSAAVIWYAQAPDSIRAAQFLAGYQLESGQPEAALETLENTLALNPSDIFLASQTLIPCSAEHDDHERRVTRLQQMLEQTSTLRFAESAALYSLSLRSTQAHCGHLSPAHIAGFLAAASRPEVVPQSPQTSHRIRYAKALQAQDQGMFEQAIGYLEGAQEINPQADTVILIAFQMAQLGQLEAAVSYLEDQLERDISGFIKRRLWQSEISRYLADLTNEINDQQSADH